MGREVRQVPENWEHPKNEKGDYLSCHDETYEDAANSWIELFEEWEAGRNPSREEHGVRYFWDWYDSPPDEQSYRPKFESEPTWFQLYETVSEGSPVSPPFAHLEELAKYLSDNGDFWYQANCFKERSTFRTKPTYEQALSLVNSGYAPSMAFVDGKIYQPHEMGDIPKHK